MQNRKALVSLLLAVFTDLVGFGIALPVLPRLFLDPAAGVLPPETNYATRTIMLGVLLALYPLVQIFSAPILGALADRHGRKPILLLSFAGTLVGYLLFGLGIVTGRLWLLVLGRAVDGVTGGNISVAQAAMADLSDEQSRAKNFGLIGMAFGLGFVIGPFLGGKLSDPSLVSWFTYATPFWFAAVLCGINIVLSAQMPETIRHRRDVPVTALTGVRNIRLAFTLERVRLLFAVMLLLVLGFTLYTSYFQVYLIERFGVSQSQIGNVFGFTGICIALAQGFLARRVADTFSPAQVLRLAPIGMAVSLVLMIVPMRFEGIFLVIPLMAVFQSLVMPNLMALISTQADAGSQGEILGINQSVVSFAQFLPGLFGGAVAAWHIAAPTLAAAVFTVTAWLVFLLGYQKTSARTFHETA